ncbi:DUF3105 domain-containing protein [Pseudonocardia sp.]|uniref:DUF3105 domain-containing protein n=1 Tax=Pseudonocardia sp. TaxID=60912 RepID=UPI003D14AD92
MVSGNKSKAVRGARSVVVSKRSTPWGLITGITVVVLFAGAVFGYAYYQGRAKDEQAATLAPFTPTAENRDPSLAIPGIVTQEYTGGQHVGPAQQVAYTHSPPFGGAHDYSWATCTGTVYTQPVRNENMVHALEHGAVWIAYDPDRVTGDALTQLRAKVDGKPYLLMSPYPGLDQPVSVQAWGHQLKVADAADPRIDQFIFALQRNPYTVPEPQGTCNELGPGSFTQAAPPPYTAAPAPGTPGSIDEISGQAAQ